MFHWPAIADAELRRACHRTGVTNLHAFLPLLAAGAFPVVVDHVFEQQSWYDACREALAGSPAYFVGVHCAVDVLEQRERARGDRRIGLARWQSPRVHVGKPYDFEVDTGRSAPDDCAAEILAYVAGRGVGGE